jgi:membrane-bound ClpP family serine protease
LTRAADFILRPICAKRNGAAVSTAKGYFPTQVLVIVASLLFAVLVVPPPWGPVLVGSAIVVEVVEKVFWLRYTRRLPVLVGREAMIGLPVRVVSACRPEGRVAVGGERWRARCVAGASVGDRLVVEAVEQLTLVCGPGAGHADDRARD